MKEFTARWDEGKVPAKDSLLGRYESNSLRSPYPNLRRMETGGGREQALAGDEEFALGQVFEVRQDTCSWVRTQDQRDSEK